MSAFPLLYYAAFIALVLTGFGRPCIPYVLFFGARIAWVGMARVRP